MYWPNDVYLIISKLPENSQSSSSGDALNMAPYRMQWIQERDKIADLLHLVIIHFFNRNINKYATGYLEYKFTVYSCF